MQNLQTDLIELLKNEDNLVVDNQLNKNKIIEAALKVEPFLIRLLIMNETFKRHFFQEVENVLVFDKIKFQRFVNNKSFLPDSYTAFKNKIGLAVNDDTTDNFIKAKNDVVLVWPHKDCVLEGGQTKEDQKRNEIFWNETLAPDSVDRLLDAKAFTNFKKYDKDGEHKVTEFKRDENLILKGNNLLILSSLLKTHRGKIKLIYIDPPYNTGQAFEHYDDGLENSIWLNLMRERLEILWSLLKGDGYIAVQIDDKQFARLYLLMSEVCDERNLKTITVKMSEASGLKMGSVKKYGSIPKLKEYIILAKKDGVKNIRLDPVPKEKWDTEYNIFLDCFTKDDKAKVDEICNLEGDITEANLATLDNLAKKISLKSVAEICKELGLKGKEKDNWLFENAYRICQCATSASVLSLANEKREKVQQELFFVKSKKGMIYFVRGRKYHV